MVEYLVTVKRLSMFKCTRFIFLICFVICLSLSSCAVNLAEQYHSHGSRAGIDYKTLSSGELPEVCRTEHRNMISSLIAYKELGYVSIGWMRFSGKFPQLAELQEFAAAQGAQVVLYSSKENGTIKGTSRAWGAAVEPEPAPELDSYDQEYEFLSKRHDR